MTINPEDLIADAENTPRAGHNALAYLEGLVQLHHETTDRLSDLEDQAKVTKAEVTRIEQHTLPDAMLQVGLTNFTTTDGTGVEIDKIVSGSIPKGNKAAAHKWLRDHGHGDIIKQDVTVSFTKEQSAQADQLFKQLVEMGFAPTRSESVHTSTLKSWAKDQLQSGVELPLTLLGLFYGRIAKFKAPKTPKAKR
jgi:hypothetical protein